MSYNYLPLDRKRLHFQQVKNLLDYNQLVSITFDAHERILRCTEFLEEQLKDGPYQFQEDEFKELKRSTIGTGEEVPIDIIKLMLMLKIKSLSYGNSGVDIEIVKRLMEMYNNEVFPVIHVQGAERNINDSALSRLSLPLIGQGEVYYQGKKIASSKVLEELNWQPIKLSSLEAKALTSGTHFLSAYAMCALKKTEQLLKIGDAIAALSFDACNYTIPPGDTSIKSGINKKGQKSSASTIYEYLNDIKSPSQKKEIEQQPYSFTSTPQIHDAAKETFNYVLTVFLEEINSVSENLLILPEENVVLERSNTSAQSLLVALDMLSISMTAFASISERRINRLARDNKAIAALPFMAESIVMENKQLSVPASLNYISFGDVEDFVSMGASAATKCLQVINNAEKVLALELLSVVSARQSKRPGQTSLFLEQLLAEVQSKIPLTNSEAISNEEVIKAVEFIQLHKLV